MSGPSSAPDSTAASAVVLRGVGRTWPGGVTALAEVDLVLPAGGSVALIGPNGGGKSTLLELFAGRLAATAGTVSVLGLDPTRRRDRRELRSRVGYVPQDIALDPEMTGAETLALFAALYGVPRRGRRARCTTLVEKWGLGDHVARRVGTYSGGLKRRLHLALGEIAPFDLLLLDEPTTGLDAAGRGLVWRRLDEHRRAGHTAVIATHDLVEAGRHCDLVAVLVGGRTVTVGSPAGLLDAHGGADLAEVYARVTGAQAKDGTQ